jgi:GTP pyrophosphokinase
MDINIKSIHFESDNGVSEGIFFLYVVNVDQLNNLINKLKKVNAVQSVTRIDNYSPL